MALPGLSSSNPGVGSILRALLLLFAAVLIAVLVLHLFRGTSQVDAQRVKTRYETLQTLNEVQAGKQQKYAWLDKAKGSVQLPLTEAMRITARELAARKPVAAYPVVVPVTVPPVAAPAPGASPAAPAVQPPAANQAPMPAPAGTPLATVPPAPANPSPTPVETPMGSEEATATNPPEESTPAKMP